MTWSLFYHPALTLTSFRVSFWAALAASFGVGFFWKKFIVPFDMIEI